jgi:hypothetical protein
MNRLTKKHPNHIVERDAFWFETVCVLIKGLHAEHLYIRWLSQDKGLIGL